MFSHWGSTYDSENEKSLKIKTEQKEAEFRKARGREGGDGRVKSEN